MHTKRILAYDKETGEVFYSYSIEVETEDDEHIFENEKVYFPEMKNNQKKDRINFKIDDLPKIINPEEGDIHVNPKTLVTERRK